MEAEELQFIGDDPGAVKYGNFINYYSFHSAKERIRNLQASMFPSAYNNQPIFCLDIGCNSGELTKELYDFLKNIYPDSKIFILAIDIDQNLIERAKESNHEPALSYMNLNVMNDTDHMIIEDYLKSHGREVFDVSFCFSVTMWIHLNNGDEGLHKFLQYLIKNSKTLIIEPQPWSCYRNAQRRVKKSGSTFPHYEKLKIRSNICNVIDKILSECTHKKVYESPNSNWNRKIMSYQI